MRNENALIPSSGDEAGKNFYLLASITKYEGTPIIFIAQDDDGQIYLGDCIEMREEQCWILSKTDLTTLLQVVHGEITLYEALRIGEGKKLLANYDYHSGKVSQLWLDFQEINAENLPENDAYACFVEEDVEEKIQILSKSFCDFNFSISRFREVELISESQDEGRVLYYQDSQENNEISPKIRFVA